MRLCIKLGKRVGLATRQLGYPTKNALKSWHREYEQRLDLPARYVRRPRYSQAQKVLAVEHYLENSRCIVAASLLRRSRAWAVPQRHCCLHGSRSCVRRRVRAPLVDPRS